MLVGNSKVEIAKFWDWLNEKILETLLEEFRPTRILSKRKP
jgi:hypothetical protein